MMNGFEDRMRQYKADDAYHLANQPKVGSFFTDGVGMTCPKVEELLDMAINGVVPNGNYGDNEVILWERMRAVMIANNLGINPDFH